MAVPAANVDFPIYLGVWTNWSLGGRVTGSVITLNHRDGAFLTAFLALFVTFAGSRIWRILCFVIHQFLLSKSARDGLYHQRQAILRNSVDEKAGFISLLRILWAWRQRANRPLYRMLPVITISLLMAALLSLAGIFSSKISAIGNEVLISSPDCGIYGYNPAVPGNITSALQAKIYNPWLSERITTYVDYAQRCYSKPSHAPNCQPFVQSKLTSTVDRNASCPFEGEVCRNPKDQNIRIDTGFLNSQRHLGLNTPTELQFNFRFVTHCAPLQANNYREIANYSSDKSYMRYFYGTQTNWEDPPSGPPYTYEVQLQSDDETRWQNFSTASQGYTLGVYRQVVYNGTPYLEDSNFLPIKELAQGDGDTAVIFLSANNMFYSAPVEDEWYGAHQYTNFTFDITHSQERSHAYLSDEPASALGCKLQYQTCDPVLPPEQGCSPLGGLADVDFAVAEPKSKRDKVMNYVVTTVSLPGLVQTLKSSSLISRYFVGLDIQAPLPVNQWQIEVENWHNSTLAIFQGLRIDEAVGPGDADMMKYFWNKPKNDEERYLCKNQKIISTAYTNFRMLWLMLILVLGVLVILLEYSLEPIIVWLERHKIIKGSSLEWFANDTLQLQRMAHEELGLGDWSDCAGPRAIPVTEKGQILGSLDDKDPRHPRLVHPTTTLCESPISESETKTASLNGEGQAEKSQAVHKISSVSQDGSSNASITRVATYSSGEPQSTFSSPVDDISPTRMEKEEEQSRWPKDCLS